MGTQKDNLNFTEEEYREWARWHEGIEFLEMYDHIRFCLGHSRYVAAKKAREFLFRGGNIREREEHLKGIDITTI